MKVFSFITAPAWVRLTIGALLAFLLGTIAGVAMRPFDDVVSAIAIVGSPAAVVLAILLACTLAQRRAIERRRETLEAARRLGEVASIAELLDEMLFATDGDGRPVFASRRLREYTGLSESDLRAPRNTIARVVHPDDQERTRAAWTETVRNGTPTQVHHRLRDARGTYRWFQTRAVPLRGESARVLGWFGVATDIESMRRRLERFQNAAAQERRVDDLLRAIRAPHLPSVPGLRLDASRVEPQTASLTSQWYEVQLLPDGRIFVCIGRAIGEHGADAVDSVARARRTIVEAAAAETLPAAVLARANTAVLLSRSNAVAAVCGFIDRAEGLFRYATAGHAPPVVATAEGTRVLWSGGLPLGVLAGAVYETRETAFDGLVALIGVDPDHPDGADAPLDDQGVVAAVSRAYHQELPAGTIVDALAERLGDVPAMVLTVRATAAEGVRT